MSSPNLRHASHFPVSVILEKRPGVTRWQAYVWSVVGVVVGEQSFSTLQLLYNNEVIEHYIYPNLSVKLYADQCESYYHNLRAPKPSCYIIARFNSEGVPEPFLVSMSFDEAHAHLEGADEVYAVPIPPELYVWSEQFIVANYFPEARKKRKRTDWRGNEGRIKA